MNYLAEIADLLGQEDDGTLAPRLSDVVRRATDQLAAHGTKDYLLDRSTVARRAALLIKADSILKKQTEIAAYHIWEKGGRQHGNDKSNWFQAEDELRNTIYQTQLLPEANKEVG